MPVHVHGDSEELFYVLAGEGLSWQDGRTYAVLRATASPPGAEAHTIAGAEEGLDVLRVRQRLHRLATWLPRAGAWWLEALCGSPPTAPDPFAAEAARRRSLPRRARSPAPSIVALADGEVTERRRGDVASLRRDLGDVLGSVRIGAGHLVVEPGMLTYPPLPLGQEAFVVLEEDGTLLLGEESIQCGRGASSGVRRAPASRTRSAPASRGSMLLAFGTREPNDIAYYPRSRKVSLRGIGVRFRIEPVDYFDGEPG